MTEDTTPDQPPVLLELRGAVALLTLNRPDRMNGWTPQLEELYFDHLAALSRDEQVRAVVVTGAGRAFCAGADMGALDELSSGRAQLPTAQGRRPETFPLSFPKPLIAAVNGACAGLGLVQALLCDVRIAEPGAKLTTSFAKVGLVAEHGISWLLPRHVGVGNALDLLMSSRVLLAEDALRMGLVQQVCEPGTVVETAVAYAEELARRVSPTAMAVIKGQVYRHLEQALAPAVEESDRLMLASFGRPDFAEGVSAFGERRQPGFPGLALDPGAVPGG